jgi:hypothetical protein
VDFLPLLASLELLGDETDVRPALALLAARDFEVEAGRLNAARRRAMFVLAAGGDPQRELELDGRAVASLAGELDAPEVRAALAGGLEELEQSAGGFAHVSAAVTELRADGDVAVRAWAAALLADELD